MLNKPMEKEDKEILLRDLCARLPYGVKVKTPNDDEVYTLLSLNPNKGIAVIGMPFDDVFATSKVKVEDIKPYLRPMLSITEEEKKNWRRKALMSPKTVFSDEMDMLYDFFNAHHLDYRDLIPMGLAIEVTEKKQSL